jgi:hypothetical protein
VLPEQPDTPVNEDEPPVAESELPVAKLVRRPRDPAQAAREAARMRRIVRAALVAVAVMLTAVFVAAFRIYPYDQDGNPRTMSTHTQLGLPPCNFVVVAGKPCPSCGMTTSFALLVRGDVLGSLRANWVGSMICTLWAGTLLWSAASAVRGKMLFIPPGRGELIFTVIVGVMVALMLIRWTVILVSD